MNYFQRFLTMNAYKSAVVEDLYQALQMVRFAVYLL